MCGIIGIVTKKEHVSFEMYESLTMLQHRGQDAAGMVTFDGRFFHEKKDNGYVREVFSASDMEGLAGRTGLGQVRYPTAGTLDAKEAQPFFLNVPFGMHLVHNGNLTNADDLRHRIVDKYRRHLQTNSDTEMLLNIFANALFQNIKGQENPDRKSVVLNAVQQTMEVIRGAYSVITLIDGVGMLAFRDPHGIRPLVMGKRGEGEWAFASEDVAFAPIGFTAVRDVKPGEAILIDVEGNMHAFEASKGELVPCIFEYIYLARPDSLMDGISVYKTRLRLGSLLAKQIIDSGIELDAVMPVPASSRPAALELASRIGIKYREGLVKNNYISRTFIMPDQGMRERSVRRKLNTVPLEFKGKSVLLVDDSIVRGTTIKRIIKMCREAGAKRVYVASAAPPVRYPNVYGVDMPTKSELIAHGKTIEEIEKEIGADKLFYQTIEDMRSAAQVGNPKIKRFEDSCFSGEYITGDITEADLMKLEGERKGVRH